MLPEGAPHDGIFEARHLSSAYQPVVELIGRGVVGAEAFARWPSLSVTPDEAFRHARNRGMVDYLDTLCQRAAVTGAGTVAGRKGFDLFVNVEPGAAVMGLAERHPGLQVVVDLRAAGFDGDPAGMLAHAGRIRDEGVGIALDALEASEGALGYLPFLAPDVIKINLGRMLRWPAVRCGRLLDAVAGYAGRTGATVLAEGIETEAQASAALRFGATLGQGFWFGRPGPLEAHLAVGPQATATPLIAPGEVRRAGQTNALRDRSAWSNPLPVVAGATLTERIIAAMNPEGP